MIWYFGLMTALAIPGAANTKPTIKEPNITIIGGEYHKILHMNIISN